MKIYQINIVCGFGSTGKIVVDLAEAIQMAGGKCRIAYGRKNKAEGVDCFKTSSTMEVYFHVLMTRLLDRHGLFSKKATKRLIKDIVQYNPDIIHLHNIHGYYLQYEVLFEFLRNYGKPVVWTLHDCWAFTGHCAHFDYVGCEKWKDECYRCPQKGEYPNSMLMDNSRDNYLRKKNAFTRIPNMTLVTVSEWLRSVTKQGFLKDYPVEKISNGINFDIFHPIESDIKEIYGLSHKKIILGVASFWSKRKGIQTFYKLAEALPEEYQIVLVGGRQEAKKESPDNILSIGRTSDLYELIKWYTAAEVYVNTSVEETMGLTTIEAMACGTPAIVMNTTANPELIREGCGLIVEPNNLSQLLDAIRSLKKDQKTVECCILRASEFEKEKQYHKYIQLYQDMLREEK